MDTVLITGGTGHLGRDIISRLTSRGHRVRVLARNPRPDMDPGIEWIKGDLATGAGVDRAVAGVDTVVHAATHSPAAQRGRLRMGDFRSSPTDVDLDGTRQLLDAARQDGCGALHAHLDRRRATVPSPVLAGEGRGRGPGPRRDDAVVDRCRHRVLLAARPDVRPHGRRSACGPCRRTCPCSRATRRTSPGTLSTASATGRAVSGTTSAGHRS